ncbi:hypothetical protein DL766_005232 [Monosporascus sp. MC13-8B]|uniref:Translation initiation factor 3 N-terminal domain-containing protein n=1 Tax=Monosporascus cannonballus TaxID=155416 RepID=A0ABY0GQC5_9PEZI|nr:hypothetical protein DL762_010356 [Monosporascus cannonballus]RYO89578.1 hypothetical protein DL763_005606 [Monosporascus cannonballus]RYP29741.1 hypothetical protein DL766_005232 [Monosporascus sp. MC13-8B]
MRRPPCIFSPARALRHIFLSSTANHAAVAPIYLSPLAVRATTAATPAPAPSLIKARALSMTAPLRKKVNQVKRRPINGQIPYKWIRLKQADGSLAPEARRTDDVLTELDLETWTLELLSPPRDPDSDPDASADLDVGPPAAICRIVDRAEAEAAAEEAARAARRKAVGTKELELNWAIAPHDLEHKLRRLREFLGKGMQVEVMLARKRGGRTAAKDESEALLARVREAALEGVPGAKEVRKMSGTVGGIAHLYFEGPPQKTRRKAAAEGGGEGEERADE